MTRKLKKKAIQIYVTEEGKKAALEITKKDKEKYGTSARQSESVSEALISFLDNEKWIKDLLIKIESLKTENLKLKLKLKLEK